MATITHSAAFTSVGLNIASGGAMTRNYGSSFSAGVTIVIGHVNSIENGSRITGASDNAGNVYTVSGRTSTTEGPSAIIYCTLHTAVTSSNVITFTKSTGQQLCVLSARAFTGSKLTPTATGNAGETTGTTWSSSVVADHDSGLAVGTFSFSQSFSFGSAPTTSPAGSTFISWFDGLGTYQCALGMAFSYVSAVGTKTVRMTGTSSGAAYVANAVYFAELPKTRVVLTG